MANNEKESKPARNNRLPVAFSSSTTVPLLLLIVLSFLTYSELLDHRFLDCWDDPEYVTMNAAVRGFSWQNLQSAFSSTFVGNYSPVQIISYILDYTVWGLAPHGFLLANIAYHTISGIMLYVLLYQLGASNWGAALGTAVFLVHPVQMESVAWVSQRKNLLAMLFFLLSFQAYRYYLIGERTSRHSWYGVSLATFLLALLAKPIAVIFPFMLILYDQFIIPVRKSISSQYDKTPYIAAAVAVGLMTFALQTPGTAGGRVPYPDHALLVMPLTMLNILAGYAKLLLWPTPSTLSIIYPIPFIREIEPALALQLFLLAVLSFGGVILHRRSRPAFFWYALFFLGLLPVAQFIPLVTKMNDRYLYFPLLGIAGLVAFGYDTVRTPHRPAIHRTAPYLAIALILLLAISCHLRGRVWKDTITLFTDAVTKAPKTGRAWFGLGTGYAAAGDFETAVRHYETGSNFDIPTIETSFSMAKYYLERGELNSANRHYLLIRMQTMTGGGRSEGLLFMGEYQGMIGNYEDAEKLLREYLSWHPDSTRGLQALNRVASLKK